MRQPDWPGACGLKPMPNQTEINAHTFLGKRTLIAGDVNSGKTVQTLNILQAFLEAGYAEMIAVIDMAPNPVDGIGGKMQIPANSSLLYLTDAIAAPRLTGRNEQHTKQLAQKNAHVIEGLFAKLKPPKKEIIFVNDATLYLQAGNLEKFLEILNTASTQIINAYYGKTFTDSALTRREKQLAEKLMKTCDEVIFIESSDSHKKFFRLNRT